MEVDEKGASIAEGVREVREDNPVIWTHDEKQLTDMFNAELFQLEPLGEDQEERDNFPKFRSVTKNCLS